MRSQLALGFGLGLCAGALVGQVVARSSSSHSATAAAATTTTIATAGAATTTVAESPDQGGAPIRGIAVLLIVTGEAETASLVAAFGAERVIALDGVGGGGGGGGGSGSGNSLRAMLLRRLARFGTLWRAPGGYAIFSLGGRVGGEAPIAALTELLGGRLLAPLPELVISCGMCGALPPGAPVLAAAAAAAKGGIGGGNGGDGGGIGDVVVAHPSAVFFERRIAGFGAVSRRQGIGETATWPYSAEVAAEAADDLRAAGCGAAVRTVKVASGRSFGSDPVGLQWMGELGAGAKDMETAPCVSTCELYGVPCAAVRVVVDVVRGDARAEEEAFEAHRAAAVPRLALGACLFARRALQWLQRTEERATLMLRVQGAAAAAAAATELLLPRAPRVLADLGRMIAVHVAMEEEAGPLAAALGLRAQAVPPFAGFGVSCWTGVFGGCPVVLAAHGVEARLGFSRVGTEMATFVTALLCQTFGGRCRAVVNAGTAGATPWSGLAIADVVLASEARFFDGRRVPAAAVVAGAAGSNGGGVREGAAEEQPASVWERTAAVAAGAGLRTAAVGTGSSFDMSPADAAALRSTGAQVKEMEAAAVVWTAAQYGTPCVCVKSITDIVRLGEEGADGGHEEFSQNLYGEAMAALARELPGVVTHVIRELNGNV
jgi:nucleoside phosphorylase